MAQPKKPTKRHEQDMFYEAMPAMADQYRFGTDTEEQSEPTPQELSDREQLTVDDTKTTAVITLILTALVALGLTLLFIRGLETLKGATPTESTSSSTLKL